MLFYIQTFLADIINYHILIINFPPVLDLILDGGPVALHVVRP
jgi:hypothetical protein